MIDYLIRCETQDEAVALVRQYGRARAYQPKVILADEVLDEEGEVITPVVPAPGYYVWVVLPDLDASLRDLPGNACRLIGDRSLCTDEASFADVLLYHAPDIDEETLASARIEPVPAGTNYPWKRALTPAP